jgi:predicted double-glycine peptidase
MNKDPRVIKARRLIDHSRTIYLGVERAVNRGNFENQLVKDQFNTLLDELKNKIDKLKDDISRHR